MDSLTKSLLALLVVAAVLGVGLVSFIDYQKNVDRLFLSVESQLKNKQFEALYSQSSDYVKGKMTQQEFVQKMNGLVGKLKQINPSLEFVRDKGWEKTTPDGFWEEQKQIVTVQKIKRDDDLSAFVVVYWNDSGIFPQFENLTITQSTDNNADWATKYEFKGFQEPSN